MSKERKTPLAYTVKLVVILIIMVTSFIGCDILIGDGEHGKSMLGATVGINTTSYYSEEEYVQLNATLTDLGYTVVDESDDAASVILSAQRVWATRVEGKPYIQISDHGDLQSVFYGMNENTPVTVALVGTHPILAGVDQQWTSRGFWAYGYTDDFVAEVMDEGFTALASATESSRSHGAALAIHESMECVFIGWNVIGSLATENDTKVLKNALDYFTGIL